MLAAPPRLRGSILWVPVDAAVLVARERFGADRVRWDPNTRTLTVDGSAPDIRELRIGTHPDRTRVVLEAARPVDWAVTAEGDGRLVVAFPGATMGPSITRREFRAGQLRALEPVQGAGGAQVRLAFAGRADQARWFALSDPFRIVIDLYRAAPSPAATVAPAPSGTAENPGAGKQKVAGEAAPGGAKHPTGSAAAGAIEPRTTPIGVLATGSPGGDKVGPDPPAGAGGPGGVAGGSATASLPTPGSTAIPAGGADAGGKASVAGGASVPAPPPGRGEPSPPASAAGPEAGAAAARDPSAAPANDAPPRPAPAGQLTIVIDPGHGGKDTGAIGPRGLKEKDVVLDIGLRLRRLLVDRLGARVVMTRADDTFIPLEERTAIANRAHADFFISIHLNAAPQARASGVETYYLSREPSDVSARASASRENLVLNLEGVSPHEQDSLKAVLWDMAESLHVQESSAMAGMLLEDLGRGLHVETRGVKHGPFVVLMTAGMPSALVEVAFISNPNQERRLQEEGYRNAIAAALSEGVERFAYRYQRRIGMQRPRPGPS
jgi:N-acetylmuramoyl-L-alanine amidase